MEFVLIPGQHVFVAFSQRASSSCILRIGSCEAECKVGIHQVGPCLKPAKLFPNFADQVGLSQPIPNSWSLDNTKGKPSCTIAGTSGLWLASEAQANNGASLLPFSPARRASGLNSDKNGACPVPLGKAGNRAHLGANF